MYDRFLYYYKNGGKKWKLVIFRTFLENLCALKFNY